MIVSVEDTFKPYADAALTRLRYLYPGVTFTLARSGIEAEGDPAALTEALCRDIHYALYREKIYAQTLPMRRALIETVTRR